MQTQEIIEALQPHNLPHMADGSFNITAAQHAAILSLLSQQEVVPPELLKYVNKSFLEVVQIEKGIKKISQYGGSVFIHFNSGRQYRLTFQLYNSNVTLDEVLQQQVVVESDDITPPCLNKGDGIEQHYFDMGYEAGYKVRQQLSQQQQQREEVMKEIISFVDDISEDSFWVSDVVKQKSTELINHYNKLPEQ